MLSRHHSKASGGISFWIWNRVLGNQSFHSNSIFSTIESLNVPSHSCPVVENSSSFATHLCAIHLDCSFLSLNVLLIWFLLIVCFCGEELFFVWDIQGRCCHFDWCGLFVYLEFETELLRDLQFQLREDQLLFWLSQNCELFWIKLQHPNTFLSERRWKWFGLYETCHSFLSARTIVACVASQKMCADWRKAT